MATRRLADLDLRGARVLARVDFNVPLDRDGRVTSDARIRAALPTIRAILDAGGRPILMSHLGRPKGAVVESLRMRPVAERLAELLGREVRTVPDCVGEQAEPNLNAHFGNLWPQLHDTARRVHSDPKAVRKRLDSLRRHWPETRAQLARIVGAVSPLRAELESAGAPVRFSDLGIDRDLARSALLHARYVRSRYTILDLAAELGHLEDWVADALGTTA